MKTNYKSLEHNLWLTDEDKEVALSYAKRFNDRFGPNTIAIDVLFNNMYGMDMVNVIYEKSEKSTRKFNGNKAIYYANAYVYNITFPSLSEAGLIQVIKQDNHWVRIG